MSWINKITASLVVISVTLLTTKVIDLTVGMYLGFQTEKKSTLKPRTIVLREYTPNADNLLAPFGDFENDTENLEYKKYRVRSDENGFIVGPKDFSDEVRSQGIDIIFFGGSTTESLFVDEETRFPYLVSEMIRNQDGKSLRVLNGGLSGNNTMHSLLAYEAKGIPLKPTFVVLMHAINDLSALSKTLTYWESSAGRDIVRNQIYDNVDMLEDRGLLFKVLSATKDVLMPNIWLKVRGLVAYRLDTALNVDEWALFRNKNLKPDDIETAVKKQFRAALISFVRVSRVWGSEPILMTQFNRLRREDVFVKKVYEKNKQYISYEEFVKLYAICNNIIRDVASQEKVLLIDLDKNIEPTSYYIYDAVHLNGTGSKAVAEIIAEALVKNFPAKLSFK